jgi:hypothetical protein
MLRLPLMELHEIFQGLGEERFRELLRQISIGKLKTYQLYEPLKVRGRFPKLNTEALRKSAPRLWQRLAEGDEDLASELAQSILVSRMDLIVAVLDFLGIPHHDGFFEKETPLADHLTDGWQQRVFEAFRETHAPALVVFYINHLTKEAEQLDSLYLPASPAATSPASS